MPGFADPPANVAEWLLQLHRQQAVFDFCGGIHFQLSLTDKLQKHLAKVSHDKSLRQPVICGPGVDRMNKMEQYEQSAKADNSRVFHGRELRQVDGAAGGMGCVLQLSLANAADPEGWTEAETADYNGWSHDSKRPWRDAWTLECDGYGVSKQFGEEAYALHHRFYLHLDRRNQIWLAAEDGCEGEPVDRLH